MADVRLIDANALLGNLKYKDITANSDKEKMRWFVDGIKQCLKQFVIPVIEKEPTVNPAKLLSMLWRDTKTNPPTEDDAGPYGKVVVWYKGALEASTAPWGFPAKMPECYPYWMPLPEPPEEVRRNAER